MEFKNIVICPDKFKGSLTALEFCEIAKKQAKKIFKNAKVSCIPIAVGGEGSLQFFANQTKAKFIKGKYLNANFKKIRAKFALKGDVAFVELAQTSGLEITKQKNPCITTTFGLGEQISHAIALGAKTIYISIGGSSTNDAGCGMACALGYKFFDENDNLFVPTGNTLINIKRIEKPNLPSGINFIALCDVQNELFGKNGAAYVYAKQKGATEKDIEVLDENLIYFNELCKQQGFDFSKIKGSGAAGGVGAGLQFFLGAKIQDGLTTLLNLSGANELITDADLVISGEGKIDKQSLCGKVVFALHERCKNKTFVAFCGKNCLKPNEYNFDIIEINNPNDSVKKSIRKTKSNLKTSLKNYFIAKQNS